MILLQLQAIYSKYMLHGILSFFYSTLKSVESCHRKARWFIPNICSLVFCNFFFHTFHVNIKSIKNGCKLSYILNLIIYWWSEKRVSRFCQNATFRSMKVNISGAYLLVSASFTPPTQTSFIHTFPSKVYLEPTPILNPGCAPVSHISFIFQ